MPSRGRAGRSPMDRAAGGLVACGEALGLLYEATRQGLPAALARADQALAIAERAVALAERQEAAGQVALGPYCAHCGQLADSHDPAHPCTPDE